MSSRVTILGGSGVVGSAATKTLANCKDFSEVVIADINLSQAKNLASSLGEHVSAIQFDASDSKSVRKAIKGSDIVVNCVGPFYKFEKVILPVVIDEGINYVDVNDDVDATYEALSMSNKAKEKGVTALIGMGSSPGITNLLASYAANELLEECESIDMFHTHGGEPTEGPGVIAHRFYCMSIPVPMYLDGKAVRLSQEESEGHIEEVEFINLPGKHKVYPYPHPEPITLPKFITGKGLKRVTNKGNVLPTEYYELTRKVFQLGLASKEPLLVNGKEVIPHDFSISFLIKKRDEILKRLNFGEPRGCVKIVCKGKKIKTLEPRTYVFSLVSEGAGKGQALGEGTGIPAAFGAILMKRGVIKEKGVLPPEACVGLMSFLSLMRELLPISKSEDGKKMPLIFESIDENGKVKKLEF
ncbi:MAG: saccharopine dehydrogenase family protein [Promethearchaeota archaeon]